MVIVYKIYINRMNYYIHVDLGIFYNSWSYIYNSGNGHSMF